MLGVGNRPNFAGWIRAALSWIALAVAVGPAAAQLLSQPPVQFGACFEQFTPFAPVQCTANDLTFLLVGRGDTTKPCEDGDPDATMDILIEAVLRNDTAQDRYDVGLYIATDRDPGTCRDNGDFINSTFNECDSDANCSGGETCEVDGARTGVVPDVDDPDGPCVRMGLFPNLGVGTCAAGSTRTGLRCRSSGDCPTGQGSGTVACVLPATSQMCAAVPTPNYLDLASGIGPYLSGEEGTPSKSFDLCGDIRDQNNAGCDNTGRCATGSGTVADPYVATGDFCVRERDPLADPDTGIPRVVCPYNEVCVGEIELGLPTEWDDSLISLYRANQPIEIFCTDVNAGTDSNGTVLGGPDGFLELPVCGTWSQNQNEVFLGECVGGSDAGIPCQYDNECGGGGTCNHLGVCMNATGVLPPVDANGLPVSCRLDSECTTAGVGTVCSFTSKLQSSKGSCESLDELVPGTDAKCRCEEVTTNIPVPKLDFSCSCDSSSIVPGQPLECTFAYTNSFCSESGIPCSQNSDCPGVGSGETCGACTPDMNTPEAYQCGAAAFYRFDFDDGLSGGLCSDTATCPSCVSNTSCTVDGDCPLGERCLLQNGAFAVVDAGQGDAAGVSDVIEWTPRSGAPGGTPGTLGIISTGNSDALTFTYTPSEDIAGMSSVDIGITRVWTDTGTCENDNSIRCKSSWDCPNFDACLPDYSNDNDFLQLDAVCPINLTYAPVASFEAFEEGGRVVVQWQTAAEIGTVGFYLLRKETNGGWVQVNEYLIPASQQAPGGVYRVIDEGASPNAGMLTYKLTEVEAGRGGKIYGPFQVTVDWENDEPSTFAAGETVDVRPHGPSARYATKATKSQGNGVGQGKGAGPKGLQSNKASQSAVGPAGLRVKIEVGETGLYFIGAQQIADALGDTTGRVQTRIRQAKYALSHRGQPVAWRAAEGDSGILFFGEAIDSLFTSSNVYWLDEASGETIGVLSGWGPAPGSGLEFTDTVHFEQDNLLREFYASDPLDDYWFWTGVLTGHPSHGQKSFSLPVSALGSGATPALLTVSLWGITATGADPDHEVEVRLNGSTIGTISFDETGLHTESLAFNPSLLQASNTVTLVGLAGDFFIDSFDLTYTRLYEAVGGRLLFSADGNPVVTVSGFSEPGIAVYDVTDPASPALVEETTIDVGATYRVSFVPPSPAGRYLAVADGAIALPSAVRGRTPADLEGSFGADYLVIAPAALSPAAANLVAYRGTRGLRTLLVDLEDVMDVFNDGIFDPEAIRAFLAHAHARWPVRPRLVTAAGDGSMDYRNVQGFGGNLFPPILAPTSNGLVAADNRYADVDGDGRLEMGFGRIPALTAAELQAYVDKIIAYEASPGGDWSRQVMMLADNAAKEGDFPGDSEELALFLPEEIDVERIYLGEPYTTQQARNAIVAGINQGAVLVNYSGHGALDRFAAEGILRTGGEVPLLVNQERLPVVSSLTCVVSMFAFPGFDSLGEELVIKGDGGAAAVWGPTGVSFHAAATKLGKKLIPSLFDSDHETLGEAIQTAINRYVPGGNAEMGWLYNLLGDAGFEVKK